MVLDPRKASRTYKNLGGSEGGITFYAFEEKMGDPAVRCWATLELWVGDCIHCSRAHLAISLCPGEYFETLGINVYDAFAENSGRVMQGEV